MSFIINWKEKYPVSIKEIFGRDAETELEIGFGNGSFLVQMAKTNPEKNFIGIELVKFFAKKANRKAINAGIKNLRIFIGDAKLLLLVLFEDETFNHIYFNFPDPWFKKKHKKRRMMKLNFNKLMARKLKNGGLVSIATDHPEFRDFVIESMIDSGAFESVFEGGYTTELERYFTTKYEEKWKSEGKEIFYMQFRKIYHPPFDVNEYLTDENLWYSIYAQNVDLEKVIKVLYPELSYL